MKNILAENMRRFGTKNLTESDFKNILAEAKSPTVLKASMLNISKKDLQPFVDTINATMRAIAKQYKQKFPKDTYAIRGGLPYVVLNHKYKKDGSQEDQDIYQLLGPENQAGVSNWKEYSNFSSKPFFAGEPAVIYHYIDSNENTPQGERISNGTDSLTRQFNDKGQFNKSQYDSWMKLKPRSMKLVLKRMLFGSIPMGGTKMLQAFQMMAKYIASNRIQPLDGLGGTQADEEIYSIIMDKYRPMVAAVSSQIDQLVDNKIAQFAASITSQVGQ